MDFHGQKANARRAVNIENNKNFCLMNIVRSTLFSHTYSGMADQRFSLGESGLSAPIRFSLWVTGLSGRTESK